MQSGTVNSLYSLTPVVTQNQTSLFNLISYFHKAYKKVMSLWRLSLTAFGCISQWVRNLIRSGNQMKNRQSSSLCDAYFRRKRNKTNNGVEYLNIKYFYEVPLESSLYQNHSEMDQCTVTHLCLLSKTWGERKAKYRGWLMGTFCGGEIGICVRVTVVSTCSFICAVHLENTHQALPYGSSVQFEFPSLSASSCQTYVVTNTKAVKMYFACMKEAL